MAMATKEQKEGERSVDRVAGIKISFLAHKKDKRTQNESDIFIITKAEFLNCG
jgi:hypothetical protein